MPFAGFDDFQDCLDHMTGKGGYDEETAAKVCGRLKADHEGKSLTTRAPAKQRRSNPPPPMMQRHERTYQLASIDEQARSVAIVASTANPGLAYEEAADGAKTPVYESIVDWDLERFSKNGKILWAHDSHSFPIGTAADVVWDAQAKELRMRAMFASAKYEGAEQVWNAVVDKLVTAVSVGFRRAENLSEKTVDGVKFRTIKAQLLEVSFVPVGEDEDALTEDARARFRTMLGPDGCLTEPADVEREQKRVYSLAGKTLATAPRKVGTKPDDCPMTKTDSLDGHAHYDALGRLATSKRVRLTQVGGIRVPARLARVGINTYRRGAGLIRELRPLEEVSRAESLETLNGAPVIDFLDHTALVTPKDFKEKAIGHVENARMDGDYIVGDLVINDADAIALIDAGERLDISAGYRTDDERTPGVWRSQPYDLVQRRIRYNHVALCPPGRGRSGPEVSLRLDTENTGSELIAIQQEPTMVKIKLDGKEYEYGSEEHVNKLESDHAVALAKSAEALKAKQAELDTLQAKLDAKDKAMSKKEEEAAAAEEDQKKREAEAHKTVSSRVKKRLRLMLRALRLLDEDEEDDGKMDALLELEDREVMLKAIKASDEKFDGEGKSDDYLQARFDMLDVSSTRGVDTVVRSIESKKQAASGEIDEVEQARQKMIEKNRNAWKGAAQ